MILPPLLSGKKVFTKNSHHKNNTKCGWQGHRCHCREAKVHFHFIFPSTSTSFISVLKLDFVILRNVLSVFHLTTHRPKSSSEMSRGDSEARSLWPMEKIIRNIRAEADFLRQREKRGDEKTVLCVLVATGALNPVHKGHVAMLEKAASELERNTYDLSSLPSSAGVAVAGGGNHGSQKGERPRHLRLRVVGGFLSPSHDAYLKGKFCSTLQHTTASSSSNSTSWYFSATDRVAMVEAAVGDASLSCVSRSRWACGRWESLGGHKNWPDFPVVVRSLRDALAWDAHIREVLVGANDDCVGNDRVGLMVLYVCGEDHFQKCGLQTGLHVAPPLMPYDDHSSSPSSKRMASALSVDVGVVCVARNSREAKTDLSRRVFATTSRLSQPAACEEEEEEKEKERGSTFREGEVAHTRLAHDKEKVKGGGEDSTSDMSSTLVRQALIDSDTLALARLVPADVLPLLAAARPVG